MQATLDLTDNLDKKVAVSRSRSLICWAADGKKTI
jgi:hypothetical protein